MTWQSQIPGCFGSADCKFAVHPLDEQRAKAAIKDAQANGATRDDFAKEMVWHCYQNVTHDLSQHIGQQLQTLHKLWP